jgi:hypothetical protein
MSLTEQLLTAAYVAAYQRTYDAARAEGLGPDAAGHAATNAAWKARTECQQTQEGNAARRKAAL